MIKSFEEVQAFGKQGFDSYVATAAAMTRNFQSIATEAADYSRRSFERTAQAAEKVLAAKSIDKAIEVQQGYAQDTYEAYVGQINKIGEIYLNAAQEAYKPFEAQVAQAAKFAGEKVKTSASK